MAKENSMDTPVVKELFKPGNAGSLPTKNYPSSTNMATKGKEASMDSPAPKKYC